MNDNFSCYDCLNVQIIIKTKGLGRTLGMAIRRTLVREVSHDLNKAPQRQLPTTSARRQQEVAFVVEDIQHVDQAADKVYEQPKETVVDDVVTDVKGFPGGPHDTSILMDYVYHVATSVWNGETFIF